MRICCGNSSRSAVAAGEAGARAQWVRLNTWDLINWPSSTSTMTNKFETSGHALKLQIRRHTDRRQRMRLRWRPCTGRAGDSGVQARAKAGQSAGAWRPVRICPQAQGDGGRVLRGASAGRNCSASKAANSARRRRPLAGMTPRPRHSASTGVKTSAMAASAARLPSRLNRAGVLCFHLGASFGVLRHQHVDGLQDVQRLEAGDDAGQAIVSRQRLIGGAAENDADVPGAEQTRAGRSPGRRPARAARAAPAYARRG